MPWYFARARISPLRCDLLATAAWMLENFSLSVDRLIGAELRKDLMQVHAVRRLVVGGWPVG